MNKDNDINIGSIKDDVEKAKELIQKMRNKRVIQVRETWNDDYGYIKALENIVSDYTRQKQINEEHQKLNGELREKIKELEEALLKVKDKNTTLFITCRNSIPVQKVKEIVKEAIEIIESEQFKIIMGDMTKVGRLR